MSTSDEDDYLNDWEYAGDSDEDADTIPCPECGTDVYEDAEQCPQCGYYLFPDTNPWHGRPAAWLLLGLAGIVAVIVAILLG